MLRKLFYFFRWPIVVFVINIFLSLFGVYDLYSWIDIPMHFLGGFVIAHSFGLIYFYLEKKNLIKIKSKLIMLFLILSVVAFVAVLWEFWEFLMDYFFVFNSQMSLKDTIFDLFMGLVGGFFCWLNL